jgi:hypothetical protein
LLRNQSLIKFLGLAALDGDRALRTVSQAGTESIAKLIVDQLGLALDQPNRAFFARRNAIAAPVALGLIDVNDFTNHGIFLSGRTSES